MLGHKLRPPGPSVLIDQIFATLAEQTVTMPGAATVELIIQRVTAPIKEFKAQRALVDTEVEALAMRTFLPTLICLQGIKPATILLTGGDFSSFQHQAAWPPTPDR